MAASRCATRRNRLNLDSAGDDDDDHLNGNDDDDNDDDDDDDDDSANDGVGGNRIGAATRLMTFAIQTIDVRFCLFVGFDYYFLQTYNVIDRRCRRGACQQHRLQCGRRPTTSRRSAGFARCAPNPLVRWLFVVVRGRSSCLVRSCARQCNGSISRIRCADRRRHWYADKIRRSFVQHLIVIGAHIVQRDRAIVRTAPTSQPNDAYSTPVLRHC
jgi:hypothetical protein